MPVPVVAVQVRQQDRVERRQLRRAAAPARSAASSTGPCPGSARCPRCRKFGSVSSVKPPIRSSIVALPPKVSVTSCPVRSRPWPGATPRHRRRGTGRAAGRQGRVAGPRTVDESFLALPLSALTDAALTRARRPRLRARRHPGRAHPHPDDQPARRPPGGARRRRGPRASPSAWCTRAPGGSPRASSSPPPRRSGSPSRPSTSPASPRRCNSDRGRARPGAGARRRRVGHATTTSTRSRVPDAEKTGLLTDLSERLLAADGVEHVQSCVHARQGAEVLRRHRRHPHPPAAGAHPPGVHRAHRRPRHRRVREHAHAGPAGRPRLGVPRLGHRRRAAGTGAASSPRSPSCCARRPRRRRSRPAATTWSSTRPTCG